MTIIISTIRIIIISATFPRYPAATPRTEPKKAMRSPVIMPMERETLVPYTSILKTSCPVVMDVPRRCSRLGARPFSALCATS